MKKVIVNICTYKRPLMLRDCLGSVLRQDIPPDWVVEVVVVDNDVSSARPDFLDELQENSKIKINYLVERRVGISFARNAACRASLDLKADWVIFIDDDEEVDPGWLLAYHKASETMQAEAFSGPVRYIFPEGYEDWLGNKGMSGVAHGALLGRASTNNVMFSSQVLNGPEGAFEFDTGMALTGGEDTDFFMRLIHRGGRIAYVSDAVVSEVVQPNRLTLRWRLKRQYQSSANRIYVELKLSGMKGTFMPACKECIRHLVEGLMRLATTPALLFLGYKRAKRSWYHGLRHYAKAAGILAGLLGRHTQPYKKTDGY